MAPVALYSKMPCTRSAVLGMTYCRTRGTMIFFMGDRFFFKYVRLCVVRLFLKERFLAVDRLRLKIRFLVLRMLEVNYPYMKGNFFRREASSL